MNLVANISQRFYKSNIFCFFFSKALKKVPLTAGFVSNQGYFSYFCVQ